MTLGMIIKEYRAEKRLSQRQFALMCNVSNGYISMLEQGCNPKTNEPIVPTLATMRKLAKAMGMSLNDLMSQVDDMEISISDNKVFVEWSSDSEANTAVGIKNIYPIEIQKIPLLGKIACGEPIYVDEDHESYVTVATSSVGKNVKVDFCLVCQGDSMIGAGINDGDIVFVKKQPMVNNGEIAVVLINDEATLKRVYYYADKSKLVLNPENPKYEPLVYIGEELNEIRILGRAIAYQGDIV